MSARIGLAPGFETEIQRLSRRAVELAFYGAWSDRREISARLYNYNRFPMSIRWRTEFPDASSTFRFLGLAAGDNPGAGGSTTGTAGYSTAVGELVGSSSASWLHWQVPGSPQPSLQDFRYKLYVSPVVSDLPEVLQFVLRSLHRWGAYSAKLGQAIQDLLRPDKLVLYFSHFKDAVAAGQDVLSRFPTMEAHGVPFTCQIARSPLVSTGVDLPPLYEPGQPRRSGSWRSLVSEHLSHIILSVRRVKGDDPIGDIFKASRQAGIDPVQWSPLSPDWHSPASLFI